MEIARKAFKNHTSQTETHNFATQTVVQETKSVLSTTKKEAQSPKKTLETDSRQMEIVQEPKNMSVEELSYKPARKTRRVKPESRPIF